MNKIIKETMFEAATIIGLIIIGIVVATIMKT
jgi:hypothetical protein